jgi:hypothetical protein
MSTTTSFSKKIETASAYSKYVHIEWKPMI